MHFTQVAIASLLASLAAAAPRPVKVVERAQEQQQAPQQPAPPQYTLAPAPPADLDFDDLENLKATKGANLHYDQDTNPDIDSSMAEVYSQNSEYPMVQLENTNFIRDLDCTAQTATVVFADQQAYQVASEDWASHDQFVMVSYDPKCGPDFDASKRDFMMVKSVTADPKTMTVNCDIEFVDFFGAFGKDTIVKVDITRYQAPAPQNLTRRVTRSTDFNWNEFPTNSLSDNRFGSGFEIFNGDTFTVQCVGCGSSGSMTMTGTLEIGFFSVDKAEVVLEGNMNAVAQVGLIAKGLGTSIPIADVQLAEIPLGALTVPGIFTLGPKITIKAGATVGIEATGDVLAGVRMDWPAVKATLDVKNGEATANGFQPNLTPVSQVNGNLSATLEMKLPIALGVGVDVANGLLERDLALTDTPGVKVTGGISTDQTCPASLTAGVFNNVNADILGFANIPIASFATDFFSTCFGGASSTADSSPSSSAPEPSSSAPGTSDAPAPTSEAPVPSDTSVPSEAPVPSSDLPPVETGVSSSEDSTDPAPTDVPVEPQPTEVDPQPTDIVPEPTDILPEPTDIEPEPTDINPEPTDIGPLPSDMPIDGDRGDDRGDSPTYVDKDYPVETPGYHMDPPASYSMEAPSSYSMDPPSTYSMEAPTYSTAAPTYEVASTYEAAPTYSMEAPTYSVEVPSYDAAPTYSMEAPTYSAEVPSYDAAPTYSMEAPTYSMEAPSYSTEAPTYSMDPPTSYSMDPPTTYSVDPPSTYSMEAPTYEVAPTYSMEAPTYSMEAPTYDVAPTYSAEAPTYSMEAPTYSMDLPTTYSVAPPSTYSMEAPTYDAAPTYSVEAPTYSMEAPTYDVAPTYSVEAPTYSMEAPSYSTEAPTYSMDPYPVSSTTSQAYEVSPTPNPYEMTPPNTYDMNPPNTYDMNPPNNYEVSPPENTYDMTPPADTYNMNPPNNYEMNPPEAYTTAPPPAPTYEPIPPPENIYSTTPTPYSVSPPPANPYNMQGYPGLGSLFGGYKE